MTPSYRYRADPKDINLWSTDAVEAAVDMYMTGATLDQIATIVGRTENAVAWKLWTSAGARQDLRAQLLTRGHATPMRYADVRIREAAFRWVLVHLRSAANHWVNSGSGVTLEALSKQAENTLLLWDGRPSLATEIEQTVAHWVFVHPELWRTDAVNDDPLPEGIDRATDDAA